MGRPYTMDLRERVVAAVERGMSRRRAARLFSVSPTAVINWMKRVRDTGSVAPGQMGGHKPRKIAGEHRTWLVERCRTGVFTLRGLVTELAARGLKVDRHSVWDFVHAEGLSFKKNRARQRTGPSRRRAATRAVAQVSDAD
jgi:putative transposase